MKIFNEDYFYRNILKCNKEKVKIELLKKNESYVKYEIPKKNGIRTIYMISKDSFLRNLQNNLCSNLFDIQPLPICVKGFVKDNGYLDFLYEHIHTCSPTFFLRIDIKNFFDSINDKMLNSCLRDYIAIDDIISVIIDICTLNDILPQGAISSPSLSNLVLRKIDQRITLYCQRLGVTYTRYADDLLFSSCEINFLKQKWFIAKIKHILKSQNLRVNYGKIKYGKDRMVLNGYVIEENVNLSRKKLYDLNSVLYFFNKSKNNFTMKYRIDNQIFLKSTWLYELNLFLSNSTSSCLHFSSITKLQDFLIGYRSYLISCMNYSSTEKINQYSNKINHIENIVDKLIQISS